MSRAIALRCLERVIAHFRRTRLIMNATTWTRNFLNAGNREWGGTMLGDLIDGADWIVMHGVADKKRLGISGASYRR
jgi:Prolyl oligopeptidase family